MRKAFSKLDGIFRVEKIPVLDTFRSKVYVSFVKRAGTRLNWRHRCGDYIVVGCMAADSVLARRAFSHLVVKFVVKEARDLAGRPKRT